MTQQPEQVTQQRVIAGRYALLDELGRGGMGIVWLAEDRTIGRRVAIKELHLPPGVPAEERRVLEERVLREARAAGRLNEPSVVTVFDVVQEGGTTYIVMELIQAPTLTDIVARQGPLRPDVVARIGEQLLGALEAAHAAGVVHRDVKPSNIMVLPNGRVKLTDFGIAQTTDDPRLTTSGMLIGSPTYLAPEVIRGGQADAASDLWALAAALFFAVEGHAAFERTSTAATMHAILTEVPYLTRCQGPLASAIMGLLNATPQARPAPQQVRGLFAQVGHPTGEQTVARAATAMYQAPGAPQAAPGRRRAPWPLVAAGVLLVACAFAGGWFGGRAGLVEPVVDPAKEETLTYGSGGQVPIFELSGGTCSASPMQSGRSYPSGIGSECTDAHDFEVLDFDAFASGAEVVYPGPKLREWAEATCAMLYTSDLVAEDLRGTLSHRALYPTADQWDADDGVHRSVYCLLANRDDTQLSEQVVVPQG